MVLSCALDGIQGERSILESMIPRSPNSSSPPVLIRDSRDFLFKFLSLTRSTKSARDTNLPFFFRMYTVRNSFAKVFNSCKSKTNFIRNTVRSLKSSESFVYIWRKHGNFHTLTFSDELTDLVYVS